MAAPYRGPHRLSSLHFTAAQLARLSCKREESGATKFYLGRCAVQSVETVGVVADLQWKEACVRFGLDDGSGVIPCVVWSNTGGAPTEAAVSHPLGGRQSIPLDMDKAVYDYCQRHLELGCLLRVQGKPKQWMGSTELSVTSVLLESDPNAEALHWCKVVQLWKHCYQEWCAPAAEPALRPSTGEAGSPAVQLHHPPSPPPPGR